VSIDYNPLLDSYRIDREGGMCSLEIRNEKGEHLSVRMGPVEARALSDALLMVAAAMVYERQGSREVAKEEIKG
jgi:hypothetical protein